MEIDILDYILYGSE